MTIHFIAECRNRRGPLRIEHLEVRGIAPSRPFPRYLKKTSLCLETSDGGFRNRNREEEQSEDSWESRPESPGGPFRVCI